LGYTQEGKEIHPEQGMQVGYYIKGSAGDNSEN